MKKMSIYTDTNKLIQRIDSHKKFSRKGKLKNLEFLNKNSISLTLHEELTNGDQELSVKLSRKI